MRWIIEIIIISSSTSSQVHATIKPVKGKSQLHNLIFSTPKTTCEGLCTLGRLVMKYSYTFVLVQKVIRQWRMGEQKSKEPIWDINKLHD